MWLPPSVILLAIEPHLHLERAQMARVTDCPHEWVAHRADLTWCGRVAVTGTLACRVYSVQNSPGGLQSNAGSIMLPINISHSYDCLVPRPVSRETRWGAYFLVGRHGQFWGDPWPAQAPQACCLYISLEPLPGWMGMDISRYTSHVGQREVCGAAVWTPWGHPTLH